MLMSVISRAEVRVRRLVAAHRRHVVLEVELLDQPGLAPVDVDRARVGLVVRAAGVDRADHAAGAGLDQLHRGPAGGPDVGEVGRAPGVGPEPAARPPPQQSELDEPVEDLAGRRPEERQVHLGQRRLLRRRAQVRAQDVRVRGSKTDASTGAPMSISGW